MTYTRHGHHIPGSPQTPRPPESFMIPCGGPSMCRACQSDVAYLDLFPDEENQATDPKVETSLEDEMFLSLSAEEESLVTRVFDALDRAGVNSPFKRLECIRQIRRAGIGFRELR